MKQRTMCLILSVLLLFTCVTPAMAAETKNTELPTITISFGETQTRTDAGTRSADTGEFETTSVQTFFEDNNMNYDYYRDWLYAQEMDHLESVTITVVPSSAKNASTPRNSGIQADRMIYVDRIYSHDPKTNQFTVGELMKNVITEGVTLIIGKYSQFVASLASILGITDPDTYFGTDKVRQGKEYYVNDGANRVVTKFVELYAPVLGEVQWYPWGYSEGDYVRHGVQLYYKGLEEGPKENVYHQYYTEHYYLDSTLVNLVKQAYSRGNTYCEVADEYAAAIGGYELYDRDITVTQYLEYDELVSD